MTQVLLDMLDQWASSDRVVCVNSFFASIGEAEKLKEIKLGFIAVMKTAIKRFPMAYLPCIKRTYLGETAVLIYYQKCVQYFPHNKL